MADGRLSDIEDLVQASVFNPSPCRRLRAQILHDAAQAHRRQERWQRGVPIVFVAIGIVGLSVLAVRVLKSAPSSVDPKAAAAAQVQSEQPGSPSAPESTAQAGTATRSEQSLGEALYFGKISRPENSVDPSTQKELTPSHQ